MSGLSLHNWPAERERRRTEKNMKLQEELAAFKIPLVSQAIYADVKPECKFTVVSYFTLNTGYEDEVKKLVTSLQKFNLSYYIEGIRNFGNWQANTHYKARFIRKVMDWIQVPVVSLDADAIVQQYPELFDTIQEDMAAYFTKKNLLSGTMYFKNNVKVKDLLDSWIVANAKNTGTWEQQVLTDLLPAWRDKVSIRELPPTYCQIFDLMKDAGLPVIEHFQASRRFKKAVANANYAKLAILVPTKGRPKSITKFVKSVIETAFDHSRVRFYFCIPEDDYNSRNVIKAMNNPNIYIVDEPKSEEVNLSLFWNKLYEASKGWADYFGFYGDDVEFQTKDWDNQVVAEFKKHPGQPWLVRTNDCYQTTMAVLFFTNRELHDLAGYYLPEYYRNVDMDTHWSHITREAGCHTFLDKVITYHHSCAMNRAPVDETHRGCRKFVKTDTELFMSDDQEKARAEMASKIRDYIAEKVNV